MSLGQFVRLYTRRGTETQVDQAAIELLYNVKEIRLWFNLIDRDSGGCIDFDEFVEFTSSLGARIEAGMVQKIKELDTDGDGTIDFSEFAVTIYRLLVQIYELYELFRLNAGDTSRPGCC